MKIKDYDECVHTNISLEKPTDHRDKVKEVYKYNYPKGKFKGSVGLIRNNFDDILDEYKDDEYKFFTYSHTYTETDERDIRTKEAIANNKIFIKSYGNDETKAFCDDDWITALGIWKKNGKWKFESYVNDDLSKINSNTFAVSRFEDDIPRLGYGGTSYDQPYLTQICSKISAYCDIYYEWDINKDDLINILQHLGEEIDIKGHKLYLIRDNVDINKIDELVEASVMKFTDVEKGRWSEVAIEYVAEKGYFKGFDDDGDGEVDTFKPTKALTREELAQVLYNMDNTEKK